MVAPVTPFVADWIHRALTGESVHLAPFPETEPRWVDRELEKGMAAVRGLTSLGRAAREEVQIRVRQPLGKMYAVTPGGIGLDGELLDLLRDELNVKEVSFLGSAEGLVGLVAKPNFRALGPRFQKKSEEAAGAIRALSTEALRRFREGEPVQIRVGEEDFTLQAEELEVFEEAREGLVVQGDGTFTAALDPTLDESLRREGLARELVNRIQRLRKESGLHITDRIALGISGGGEVTAAAEVFEPFITKETLAREYRVGSGEGSAGFDFEADVDLDGQAAKIGLSRLTR
jgi:isoleucyl-tRNA synthetase